MKVECMLSPEQLAALADPPSGFLDHKAGMQIAQIVRSRKAPYLAEYVVGVWRTKGPVYRIAMARFYRDGHVETVERGL